MAKAKIKEIDPNQIIEVDPSVVQLDPNNVRFGLKKFRLERLMDDILDRGQKVPVELIQLPTPVDGITHQVHVGNYRTSAIQKLNAEKKAGLKLRAIIVPAQDPVTSLKDAIADNTERENMSVMDCAVAIKQLFDADVPRPEIRRIFARPTGKKGLDLQPASNAWVNMVVRFLDFPEKIQARIHDGRIGVEGAYELYKNKPENWEKIADKIEDKRLAAIDVEVKDETKFLEDEKKRQESEIKKAEADKKINDAKTLAETTAKAELEAGEALSAAFNARKDATTKDKDERKKLEETFKAADNAYKSAKDVAAKAKVAYDKLTTPKTATEPPEPKATTSGKKAGKGKAAGSAGKRDVAKAAKEVDEEAKAVKRTSTEMREGAKSLMILSPNMPKTKAIGEAFLAFFDGKIEDGQLHVAVSKLTGEYKEKK